MGAVNVEFDLQKHREAVRSYLERSLLLDYTESGEVYTQDGELLGRFTDMEWKFVEDDLKQVEQGKWIYINPSNNPDIYLFPTEEHKELGIEGTGVLWGLEEILPNLAGKTFCWYPSIKLSKDGYVEIDAVVYPFFPTNQEAEVESEIHRRAFSIQNERFNKLYKAGLLTEDDLKALKQTLIVSSITTPIGFDYDKLIGNVLAEVDKKLPYSPKLVIELEDARETGLLFKRYETRWVGCSPHEIFIPAKKIPLRITVWDWERVKVFPLSSQNAVYLPDDPYTFPTVEEFREDMDMEGIDGMKTIYDDYGWEKLPDYYWERLRNQFIELYESREK